MPNRGPEEYLALAQHAEQAAVEAETAAAKSSWQTIAQEYRMLAAEKLRRMQAERESKSPPQR